MGDSRRKNDVDHVQKLLIDREKYKPNLKSKYLFDFCKLVTNDNCACKKSEMGLEHLAAYQRPDCLQGMLRICYVAVHTCLQYSKSTNKR